MAVNMVVVARSGGPSGARRNGGLGREVTAELLVQFMAFLARHRLCCVRRRCIRGEVVARFSDGGTDVVLLHKAL